ncbi:hypothetical protein POVCU2_0005950 [Plasmodium ovale curtisi]|uniref:Uncharacterized protein n=1 Tax=Plasmodium ovale curtisi TaxID=864141 RepID=A0A1A8VMN3_PLAOA|nr:hypothetical protein POVCU2_0005950 [Plasmodium ovale curtisi]SBS81339.1 hypothetical protein POVCU1_005330 [Plasmodium ovale curtisi]
MEEKSGSVKLEYQTDESNWRRKMESHVLQGSRVFSKRSSFYLSADAQSTFYYICKFLMGILHFSLMDVTSRRFYCEHIDFAYVHSSEGICDKRSQPGKVDIQKGENERLKNDDTNVCNASCVITMRRHNVSSQYGIIMCHQNKLSHCAFARHPFASLHFSVLCCQMENGRMGEENPQDLKKYEGI